MMGLHDGDVNVDGLLSSADEEEVGYGLFVNTRHYAMSDTMS